MTAEDRPLPSPRTADEPMAVTRDELLRGAVATVIAFLTLLALSLIALGGAGMVLEAAQGRFPDSSAAFLLIILVVALIIAAPVSMIAAAVLLPVTWLIARALRRVSTFAVHLLVYAALGIGMGALALTLTGLLFTNGQNAPIVLNNPFGWVAAAAAAFAVPIGWAWTARRALRSDRRYLAGHAQNEVEPAP